MRRSIMILALITLLAPIGQRASAEPRGGREPVSFGAFYDRNKNRATPGGTLQQVYTRALKRNIVDEVRKDAGQYVKTAASAALSVASRLKKLGSAVTLVRRGWKAARMGELAHDAGKDHGERERPLGDDVAQCALLACTMIPRVKVLMPKVFAAMACKSVYDGSKMVLARRRLARGELLATARAAGIEVNQRLYGDCRRDVEQLKHERHAGLDEAVARIREHRPLVARANLRYGREADRWKKASALAEKTWHGEIVERGLASAREEKRELQLIQRVVRMMDRQPGH